MVYIRHEKKEPILTSHCHWKTVDLPKRTVPIYATKHISQWSFTVVNNARSVIQTLRDKQGTWLRDFDYTEMLKAAPVIYVEIVTQQLTNFLRALGPKLGYLSFVFLTANWTDDLHFKYETTTAGDDYLARAVQVVLRDHPGSNFHLLDGISDELRAYWKRVCGGEESEKDVKSKLQITLGERKGCPTGVRWQLSPSTRKVARQFFTISDVDPSNSSRSDSRLSQDILPFSECPSSLDGECVAAGDHRTRAQKGNVLGLKTIFYGDRHR
ncbi:hypothetical protein LTS18_001377 [Coniosporium uncinatum]|uniref:Uncharacterized protein n=1 Tax=Coniosporium uncinatum TaxID=93489 RepID=A0ACC3D879_9PEZI|nr:hypothetical protein LTS18_001377 [Coniosporium uncinatum]